jgi:hypothetical protein
MSIYLVDMATVNHRNSIAWMEAESQIYQTGQRSKMVDEVKAQPTEKELKAQLDTAMKGGDWKAIAKVAGEIAKLEKGKEDAAKELKLKALEGITEKVKAAIQKAVQPFIDSKQLDVADGVWFSQDFGEKLVTCKVTKTAVRKATGGGGGVGKKFDVSTTDMLAKYGDKVYKDGVTFKVAWEADADKNKRFAIRTALLKLDGQIK